jgi:hypothetical protein
MSRGNEPPEIEREPASPLTYGRWAQRADRRHGRRDGRRRIPSLAEVTALVESDAPAQLPTPYLEMLNSRARDMMEHERMWYLAATSPARAEQAELASQAASARAALPPAEALREKAKVELTEADLLARHPAEELRSDVFIRLRREAEREQRIAAAEAAYLRLLANVHAVEERLARVTEYVHNRLSIARMRALRISAYLSARTATYWEGLVLAHRDGKHLAPLLPHMSPRLPAWVVPEDPATQAETVPERTGAVPTRVPPTGVAPGGGPSSTPSTHDTSSAQPAPPSTTDPNATESTGGADAAAPQVQPVPAHRH